jgi:5-formyltetrahydrofolate cyclo-ligase
MSQADHSKSSSRKKELRRKCFAGLKELRDREKSAASDSIAKRLIELPEFQAAKTVFAYLPLSSEPDLRPLFDASKTWGFARILPGDSMEFREMSDLSNAIEGEFKILEPDPAACPVLPPGSADLVIVPGVGFCPETGNRLGRGKGHYDRYLEKLTHLENRPKLVGICFAVQICEVESESHDIPMDLVISA